MGPAFFDVLARVGRIHANCRRLLRTHHQRAGLELMDAMSAHQEAAYERLCRFKRLCKRAHQRQWGQCDTAALLQTATLQCFVRRLLQSLRPLACTSSLLNVHASVRPVPAHSCCCDARSIMLEGCIMPIDSIHSATPGAWRVQVGAG